MPAFDEFDPWPCPVSMWEVIQNWWDHGQYQDTLPERDCEHIVFSFYEFDQLTNYPSESSTERYKHLPARAFFWEKQSERKAEKHTDTDEDDRRRVRFFMRYATIIQHTIGPILEYIAGSRALEIRNQQRPLPTLLHYTQVRHNAQGINI